ncbi:hypothetical protein Tco_0981080 [Tanacetum coccineum]
MAESSSHNPSSPEITPKEEPVSTPTSGIRGDIGITTFRNALRAHYLPHSSMYVSPPSITVVRPWFATIGYNGEIKAKGTLKKSFLPPSVLNWALKLNQHEGPPFTDHGKAICNIDVAVDSQALKTSSQTEKVPQDKETQSSSAKDKSPNHPSPSTSVVGEMHKEAPQAAGGPTSLEATSEEGAHPQLSSGMSAFTLFKPVYSASFIFTLRTHPSVLVDKTKSARDGLKTAHTDLGTNEESRANEISKKIKLEDLSDLIKDARSAFFTPDSPQDKPIIISDGSEEEETEKDKDTHTTSHDELPAEFLDLPSQVSSEKLKTLDSLPSILNKVTDTLNRFSTMVETASGAVSKNVPSTGQATVSSAEGKKNTNPATRDDEPTNLHNELVYLLGIDIVTRNSCGISKALLASLDVSALDKPHFQLENLLRRFIRKSSPDDACTDDGITTLIIPAPSHS